MKKLIKLITLWLLVIVSSHGAEKPLEFTPPLIALVA